MFNLFLAEHSEEVLGLIRRGMKDKGKWIALGPSAMYELRRLGIVYRVPEEFYEAAALEEICLKAHRKVELVCNRLDEKIKDRYPELKKWGMRPFLFNAFEIIRLIDSLSARIFQLKAILKAYNGYKVWAYKNDYFAEEGLNIAFSNDETLWGNLLSLTGWKRDIEFIEKTRKKPPAPFLGEGFRKFILQSFFLRNMITGLSLEKTQSLLLHRAPYEWKRILPLLRKRGWKVFFTNDEMLYSGKPDGENKKTLLTELVESDPVVMNLFEFDGISFYGLVEKKIDQICKNAFPLCSAVVSKLEKIIITYRVKAMLSSLSSTFVSHAAQQAMRYFGLPVISWQHGYMSHNNGCITQLNDFNDMMTSDAVLTFGEEDRNAHLLHTDRFPSKVIPVGSPSVDKIRNCSLSAKEGFRKKILYVTTAYTQNLWYCGFSPPFNDLNIFRDQLIILKCLKELAEEEDVEVTVKLNPASRFLTLPAIDDFCKVLRVVRNSPSFADLLAENHVIIIDTPTTTAVEAAATKKPIFILTNHVNPGASSREMLKKRAVCANNAETLMHAVKLYLKDRAYAANPDNDEYLMAHGTYKNNSRSGDRAVEALSELISANRGRL